MSERFDADYSHARLPTALLHDPALMMLPAAGRWCIVAWYLYCVEIRRKTIPTMQADAAFLATISRVDRRTATKMLQRCKEIGLIRESQDGGITLANIERYAHRNTKWRDAPEGVNAGEIQNKRVGNKERREKREEKGEKSEEGAPTPATPTLTDVLTLASEIGHPADDAERYVQNRASRAWRGVPDWQADFKAWAARYRPPAPSAPASVNRFDPDAVDPEVVAAQNNRRRVKEVLIAAAETDGRRLSLPECRKIIIGVAALAALPGDDVQHGITAALNSVEFMRLPAAGPSSPGPMAATLTRLALKAGVG